MPVIDELLVGLGFEYDQKQLSKFQKDVDKTVSVVKQLAIAATAAATAITGLVVASTAASDEQGKFAGEVGESVENIDALQFALQRTGGNADGLATSLRSLASKASEAARGMGAGVEVFGMLGISATDANGVVKTTTQLMKEVSGMMQGLSRAQQIEFAEKLGISDAILLLQQGPKEMESLIATAKALGVTTAEDAAIAAEFQDSLVDLWRIVKQGSRIITRELAPVMDATIGRFTDWWIMNRELIQQKLPEFINKISSAMKILAVVTGVWLSFKLLTHINSLLMLITALNSKLLITNVLAAIIPALIFGAVAAIALLAEDAKVFFEGGDSFLSDMIEKFPKWTAEIEIAAAALATISDLAIMAFNGWKMIFDLFSSGTFLDDISAVIKQIKIDISGLWDGLLDFGNVNFDKLIASFTKLIEDIKSLFSKAADEIFETLQDKIFDPIARPFKAIKAKLFGPDDENVFGINSTENNIFKNGSEENNSIVNNISKTENNIFNNTTEKESNNTFNNIMKQAIEPTDPAPILSEGRQVDMLKNSTSKKTNSVQVDKIEIQVNGAGNPKQVAKEINDIFHQTAQDLTTTVDQ